MITIKSNLIYKLVINANTVSFWDRFILSQYNSFTGLSPWGMKSISGSTICINLTQSEDEILQGCKSNTRNEIRRAIREDFYFKEVKSIDAFVQFYNAFAKAKNLDVINRETLAKFGDRITLYESGKNGVTMSMHASAVDEESGIATLLYSASVRLEDNIDRKDIGFSNRYLHYMEFLEFKKMGLKSYDINGVCLDPEQKEKYSIGQFKAGFGGQIETKLQLLSYPWIIAYAIKRAVSRI